MPIGSRSLFLSYEKKTGCSTSRETKTDLFAVVAELDIHRGAQCREIWIPGEAGVGDDTLAIDRPQRIPSLALAGDRAVPDLEDRVVEHHGVVPWCSDRETGNRDGQLDIHALHRDEARSFGAKHCPIRSDECDSPWKGDILLVFSACDEDRITGRGSGECHIDRPVSRRWHAEHGRLGRICEHGIREHASDDPEKAMHGWFLESFPVTCSDLLVVRGLRVAEQYAVLTSGENGCILDLVLWMVRRGSR